MPSSSRIRQNKAGFQKEIRRHGYAERSADHVRRDLSSSRLSTARRQPERRQFDNRIVESVAREIWNRDARDQLVLVARGDPALLYHLALRRDGTVVLQLRQRTGSTVLLALELLSDRL
ncbi:hypothetical protein EG329_013649 [Mollisiaceae sp. DMI_Dod_QoI]|nr:hypothetical protein EG329_013649 [Helotiales sp. DMI_Dod_QoI]